MPRRTSTKPAPTTTTTPLKRRSPASHPPSTTPRTSKRLKSSPISKSTTPKKSKYFSHPPSSSEPESEIANEESGYEDEDASISAVSSPPSSSNEEEDEDEYASDEEDTRPMKRKSGRPSSSGGAVSKAAKGQELWRPGVKTGLGPGKQVFIALPKARGEGGVRYQDGRIHPNTMLFLGELKANNDREWLKVHDADYRQSKKDFDTFVESLTEKIIEKDETIPELPPKDLTFRIYRDIRFSSDPTPYKTYFSAAWSRTGRKGPYAGYYVQISPFNSFIGAGIWHPESAPLSLLRQAVDGRSHQLKTVLMEARLRKEFLGGVGADEKKVVGKFVEGNGEGMLKTRPKGYDPQNPNLPLLRLRNYTVGRKLRDEEVVGPGGLERIVDLMGVLVPFVGWLNGVVMPDGDEGDEGDDGEGGEEDSEEGDEGEEEGEEDRDGNGSNSE